MSQKLTRRDALLTGSAIAGAGLISGGTRELRAVETAPNAEPFGYCLNTSTIRGQELGLAKEVDIAAEAGYSGIEPWIREIQTYVDGGGKLSDLKKRIADRGLSVESAIGFAPWIVDDDQQRKEGLETMRHDMDLVRQIGGARIAAPPVGATDRPGLNLFQAADRYRAVLELGDQIGVVPQVELWGFSQSLSRLGELLLVASESNHPAACLLPDVYHIFKGGSGFDGLGLVSGNAIHVFHVNDYPGDISRADATDADRVYPGDGAAPLGQIVRVLYQNGFRGMLSLELFNRQYWQQDALEVARTGLEKTRAAVRASLAS
jgi:sugar phosphate isomerase/epimerase